MGKRRNISLSFPVMIVALLSSSSSHYNHVTLQVAAAWSSSSSSPSLVHTSSLKESFERQRHGSYRTNYQRQWRTTPMQHRMVSDSSSTASTSNIKNIQRTQYTINDSDCPPTQSDVLEATVRKTCANLDKYLSKKPIARHTQQAFDALQTLIQEDPNKSFSQPIILDSGCGTGRSSILLGRMHPDHLVIGVDRSYVRLSKQGIGGDDDDDDEEEEDKRKGASNSPICESMSDNVVLLRAELVDFWRCIPDNWNITDHYLLYPNPYPKLIRLTLRWYAHPSFPLILKLGGNQIILRSNWKGYLNEFAKSVEIAHKYCSEPPNEEEFINEDDNSPSIINYAQPYLESAQQGPIPRTDKTIVLTNFERKYDAVGEPTYELRLVRSSTK